MALHDRVKVALDETRTLLLAAQILVGFEFQAAFQPGFAVLPGAARAGLAWALVLMVGAVGALVAPSAFHRIAERGESTGRMQPVAGRFAALGLLGVGASLGIDLGVALRSAFASDIAAAAVGALFACLAFLNWFGAGWRMRRDHGHDARAKAAADLPRREQAALHVRIEQMLTEIRVILPGAQALLGFQLVIVLSSGFSALPASSRLLHGVALVCLALTAILLVAPPALHRIVWAGGDSEAFLRIGGRFAVASLLPLAVGIVADTYVVLRRMSDSLPAALAGAAVCAGVLGGLWLAWPWSMRRRLRERDTP